MESSDIITFPRVKRRPLQLKDESDHTYDVSNIDVEIIIRRAKDDAIETCRALGMTLLSYDDKDLTCDTIIVDNAVDQDDEEEEEEDNQVGGHDSSTYEQVEAVK